MVCLNDGLRLEVQGWDACVMAKALFSSPGQLSLVFHVKGPFSGNGQTWHSWELWGWQEADYRWKGSFPEVT